MVEVLATAFHRYLFRCAPPPEAGNRFDEMRQRVTIAPLREDERVVGSIIKIEDVTARLAWEQTMTEHLESEDESVRLAAAKSLAEEEGAAAQALLFAVGDESWRVRRVATAGLVAHGGEEAVAALLTRLHKEHSNPSVLASALRVFETSEVDTLVPLSELLRGGDKDLRTYAALSLGERADPRAADVLIKALGDEDINVRFHAIEALGRIGAAGAAGPLAEIASTGDFFLGFAALEAITRIGNRSVAPRLVPLLESELLVSAAAVALGSLGDAEAVAPLAAALEREGAPVLAITTALAELYERYESLYREGAHVADLARAAISEEGIRRLTEDLNEAGKEEMRGLALVLGWLEGDEVERALTHMLGQPTVRREVVDALVRHGTQVVELLAEKLSDEDMDIRKAAVIALGRIGDERAVPALVGALKRDEALRVIIADALAKLGDRRAFEPLLALLGDEDVSVRQAAIAALNSIGHPEMPARAAAMLRDEDALVRESAVRIAGYFGFRECIEPLLDCCAGGDVSVRCAAVEQLPFLEDPRAVGILGAALCDESPKVRVASARALGYVEHKYASLYLLASLGDLDAWVRYFSVRSLARHRLVESIGALAELARNDAAMHVRIAAVEALGQIGGPRVVAILSALAEGDDWDLAGAAVAALGSVHHPDEMPPLVAAVCSPNTRLRLKAIGALRKRGGFESVSILQWVLGENPDAPSAHAAIDALAHISTQEAVSTLVNLTTDERFRAESIVALGGMSAELSHLLARGLLHKRTEVRLAVVEALARMKHRRATEVLAGALSDTSPVVRLAAVGALAHLGSHAADARLAELARADTDATVREAAQRLLRLRSTSK